MEGVRVLNGGVHISVAYINPTFRITHLRLLHSISVGPALFRSNTVATTSFPVASERLGKLGPLSYGWAFPVEDVDRNRDTECKTGKDCRRIFKSIFLAKVCVDCGGPCQCVLNWGRGCSDG